MNFNLTPAQARQKWVEALESGMYKQGSGYLKMDNPYKPEGEQVTYCCLGVACELFNQLEPDNRLDYYKTRKGENFVRDYENEGKETDAPPEEIENYESALGDDSWYCTWGGHDQALPPAVSDWLGMPASGLQKIEVPLELIPGIDLEKARDRQYGKGALVEADGVPTGVVVDLAGLNDNSYNFIGDKPDEEGVVRQRALTFQEIAQIIKAEPKGLFANAVS